MNKLATCVLFTLFGLALSGVVRDDDDSDTHDNPLLTCLTHPCVQVDGVGKILGTKKNSDVSGRDIYSYYSIPYGKPTSGDLRFAPPQPADPINDGSYRFDGSY